MLNPMLKGRYQIIQKLTQGGFGVTFLAEDSQRPGSPRCIVKKLQPRFDDEPRLEIAKRLFVQEAETLEKLGKHHQIPQLLAYFDDNQDFYLVQEYIEGHDLSQEIPPAGNKLSEIEVIKLLTEIVEVLDFVHQNKVIHRDIKPSNIRRRKSDGKIVLIDFGAVKEIQNMELNQEGETNFTVPVGTPGYMPSEQAIGTPNFSSDIYALGIIVIQALTGIYFNQKGEMPRGKDGEIDWRSSTKVNPDFADIIDKMVRYDHRKRYVNAIELLNAIKTLEKPKKSPLLPKISIVLLALLAVLGLASFFYKLSSSSKQVNPVIPVTQILFSAYEDKEIGVKFKYPEGWARQDLKNPFTGEWVSFIAKKESANDNFQEKITVGVQDFSGTLDESKNTIVKQVSQSTNVTASQANLANKAAYQLVYTTKDEKHTLKNLKIWTLKSDKAYMITYTAKIEDYDKFLKTAETVINSFEIK
jgi:eukaryotic-like serine/threonine-protein kinase